MEKFIRPEDLLPELCSIVTKAEKEIQIICPFAELHHNFSRALKSRINHDVSILFLYGKSGPDRQHFQLKEHDLNFLKTFPKIKIAYNSRLHAKFYANEKTALVTTLNLNLTSANNNIEYGIKLDGHGHALAKQIRDFITEILAESEIIFESPTKALSGLAKIKVNHLNAYEPWEEEDDQKLKLLYFEKKGTKDISEIMIYLSEIFKRQPSAIKARIKKLELG